MWSVCQNFDWFEIVRTCTLHQSISNSKVARQNSRRPLSRSWPRARQSLPFLFVPQPSSLNHSSWCVGWRTVLLGHITTLLFCSWDHNLLVCSTVVTFSPLLKLSSSLMIHFRGAIHFTAHSITTLSCTGVLLTDSQLEKTRPRLLPSQKLCPL